MHNVRNTHRGLLVLGLLGLLCNRGEARELLRKGFPTPKAAAQQTPSRGERGRGWTQTDCRSVLAWDVAFDGARRGAISFDLQRLPTTTPKKPGTVFELLDAERKRVLRLMVVWDSGVTPSRPAVMLKGGEEFTKNGLDLWSSLIPLDTEVRQGQWIHVDLTWDDPAHRYDLHVNGRPVDPRPGTYDSALGRFVPDWREAANRVRAAQGLPVAFLARPFGTILSKVRSVELGNHDDPRRPPGRERALLASAAVDNFVVVTDEAFGDLHGPGHDVRDLQGAGSLNGILLTWAPPETHGIDQAFVVYRRAAEGNSRFERLTPETVHDLQFLDATPIPGRSYRYSVASVYSDLEGRTLEGKYPPEITATAADLAVVSVAADKAVYGAGQEIVVTLRGTANKNATYTLEGVAKGAPMVEMDDGVYVATARVPTGLPTQKAALTGTLADPGSANAATRPGRAVSLDAVAPEAVGGIVTSTPWAGEVQVAWRASPSADVDHYAVFRAVGNRFVAGAEPYAVTREFAFVDPAAVPGVEYHYAVAAVDRAGNRSDLSDVVTAHAPAGDGPRIAKVSLEPFGRPLRPGQSVTATLVGASGGRAYADLGALVKGLALTEQGRSGTYVGTYAVRDADVAATLSRVPVVAHLTDDFGASQLAGPEVAVIGRDSLDDHTPPALTAASHDGWQVAGLSGRLVAGDIVTVKAQGEPGGIAWCDVVGVAKDLPLAETAAGTYVGTFTVHAGDAGATAPVTVHLSDPAGNETTLAAEKPLAFDTRLRLTVEAADRLLPADRATKTRLTAKAVDANGAAIERHELVLTLSTTEEYTGVVGGGTLAGRQATMDDVDDVEVKWGGVTDNFGEVTADYTAGFAAKTALVIAKDLTTGDVGAGWLNTYVSSTVAIELLPRAAKGAEDRAVLRMSATPAKLTADGRSTSRIKLWLTDLSGTALAGAKVSFSLGSENGRLKVLRGTTDAKGVAEAEYRAGTAIGTVTVTAAAAEYGVTGSLQITLMSDAPAKIDLAASATKLIADGAGKATLSVAVTDIHDNPNSQVPVTFAVLQGSGSVRQLEILTDRNGEGSAQFVAGTRPGTVIVEARHTSRAPTGEELRRVYGTLFVPRWFERQERERLKVAEWLVTAGEAVERGQTLAVLATRRGEWTVTAPAQGVFVRQVKHEDDAVELGETLGYVEIDPDVWKTQYAR